MLDVAGRPASPYQSNPMFAACPVKTNCTSGIANFVFKQSLFFKNQAATVSSFYVDFADGKGYRAVTWNNTISASYTDTGMKQLKIKMLLSTGSYYQCYSNYYVANAAPAGTAQTFSANYDAFQPFYPISPDAGANVYITYSRKRSNFKIIKPLIVVEGFDASSIAPDLVDNYTDADFVNSISQIPNYDFNSQLDNVAGYDLIFVDFNNGTDDIRNNAELVERIINWVNAQKAANGSTEQNVVMGLSMGGLVARYALADMTKTSGTASTGTRLLITHDSPHEGANVPLGYQYLIEMAGQIKLLGRTAQSAFPAYSEAINLLSAPATQQLLLYRATGPTTCVANSFLSTTYRSKITFAPSDHQPSYKFIATSLGSQCGHSLFNPSQLLISAGASGSGAGLLFIVPIVTYNLNASLQAWALPNNGATSQIANVSLSSKFRLFGFITIQKNIYSNTAYAPGYQIPVDGAPGGIETVPINKNISGIAFKTWTGVITLIGFYNAYATTYQPQFDFVPAVSTLDAAPFNTAALSQDFVSGTNANYPATSSNYIAQETFTQSGKTLYNNAHIQFTARNSQWLYDQMENITDNLNCSSECSPVIAISGPAYFCSSSQSYSVNAPPGSTVSWSISPSSGVASISPTTGNTTTLTKQGSGGIATLSAIISSNCGSPVTITKTISAGNPFPIGNSNFITNSNSQYYQTVHTSLTAITSAGGTAEFNYGINDPLYSNLVWTPVTPLPPGTTVFPSGNALQVNMTAPTSQGQYSAIVNLTTSGPCGTLNLSFNSTTVYISGYGFSAFPVLGGIKIQIENNQVLSNNVTSATANKNQSKQIIPAAKQYFYTARIIDLVGRIRKTEEYKQGISEATIHTGSLETGIYIVSVFDGKEWHNKKILIP